MKINLNLVGLDSNAFSLLSAFRKQAIREGNDLSEIEAILEEAKNGDYDHLLNTLMEHTEWKKNEKK